MPPLQSHLCKALIVSKLVAPRQPPKGFSKTSPTGSGTPLATFNWWQGQGEKSEAPSPADCPTAEFAGRAQALPEGIASIAKGLTWSSWGSFEHNLKSMQQVLALGPGMCAIGAGFATAVTP